MEPSDLGLLVPLDALLQEGSVTGAARRVGLSTPAMSHTLARIREQLKDPVLVRSGRGMILTPRALAMREQIRRIVAEAQAALGPAAPFVPGELARTFVVHATDYVLTVLGAPVDRILREEAPGVCMRFVPNTPDDPASLREGADLAVGIYGALPQEMRHRQLLTDRFVCVVRQGHPAAGALTPERFAGCEHLQVAPRGNPGGYIDDVLRQHGLSRRVTRAVPYFLSALHLVAVTGHMLTVPERIARRFAGPLGLEILEIPLDLSPYALSLLWHPRMDADAGHRFLRDVFLRAAREAAGERHATARTRLDAADPTTGERRKRRPRGQKLQEMKP